MGGSETAPGHAARDEEWVVVEPHSWRLKCDEWQALSRRRFCLPAFRVAQRQRNHLEFDPDSVRGSSGMASRKSKGSYRMNSRTSTSLTVTVRAGVTAKRT